MLRTRLCDLFGVDYPIICAPMGFVTGPELAAAVSNAGGLGIMSFGANPPDLLRREIRRLRALTDRPFGVNVLLDPKLQLPFPPAAAIAVCLDERVPVLSLAFGDPAPVVHPAHEAGALVVVQVGSVAAARRAAAAGVDVVIAQGVEAGGHLSGEVALTALVPRVVDAVAPVPVAAAGGIADARGLVAMLALGAEAVVLGTRFLATPEATAHPLYKTRVVAATEDDTERTLLFGGGWPDTPLRVLRTAFVADWSGQETRGQAQRPDEPVIGETVFAGQRIPVRRFSSLPPSADATGDVEAMALCAGQGVGLVREIKPAAEIVRELVDGAREIVERRFVGELARVFA